MTPEEAEDLSDIIRDSMNADDRQTSEQFAEASDALNRLVDLARALHASVKAQHNGRGMGRIDESLPR